MIKEIANLNQHWTLTLAENKDVKAASFNPTTPDEVLSSPYLHIPAAVPGNFELDLFRAGIIEDPFYGDNPIMNQALENRHLWYTTTFDCEGGGDEYTYLSFEGIDTVADIYLNGTLLAHTENMLVGYTFQTPNLTETGNTLVVHIIPATIYARALPHPAYCNAMQYDFASLQIRKSPSMYGWDIMPRYVSGGLWKEVKLIRKTPNHIDDVYLWTQKTDPTTGDATIQAQVTFSTEFDSLLGMTVTIEGQCGDSHFSQSFRPFHTCSNFGLWLRGIKLWYPRNAGEANLYDIKVTLARENQILDVKSFKYGIRKVNLIRTSTTNEKGEGEFRFEVNGKKVFCMGSNWVPLDAFHSRDLEMLPSALALAKDIGCNILRVWGGNVYESDAFYDFCDENGIMVWQDFVMGCAIYPETPRFMNALAEEAEKVIFRLRNHCSLILWAGDNEIDESHGWNGDRGTDPNDNTISRKLLPHICRMHDPSRPFLPSSPYIDEECFKTKLPPSEAHLWGPRDYFKGDFYRNTVCHFASETGYHGCNSPESLKRFIRPEHLWPNERDGATDPDWLVHCTTMELTMDSAYAYRIRLMTAQIKTLFGTVPEDLDTYARMSQISQAEAKKYFIERFRLSKWRRTGIIWWNLIDGWPQISDAVVDYYRQKKLAYHFIKRSQAPVCLMFDEPKDGMLDLYTVNDTQAPVSLTYEVIDLLTDTTVARGSIRAEPDSSCKTDSIPTAEEERMLLIRWSGDERGDNHYTTCTKGANYATYYAQLQKAGYDTFEGF